MSPVEWITKPVEVDLCFTGGSNQYTYFGWEVLCEAVLCLRFDVSRGEVIPLRKASSGGEQGAIYVESYDALLKTPIISSGGGGNRTRWCCTAAE
jgi:hypothetical protein